MGDRIESIEGMEKFNVEEEIGKMNVESSSDGSILRRERIESLRPYVKNGK
jgi:hypothetical protein